MNSSQSFKVPGSCIPNHVDLAVLAEPRFAVAEGQGSASKLPFSLSYRNKGINRVSEISQLP